MGLLLSVLIGCAGVLELIVCARHVSNTILVASEPPTPCLSYHPPSEPNVSMHDSICSFSHSKDIDFPKSVRHKLENLHEYSLRVRNELKALDPNFDVSTLSECSTREYFPGSRPDSRLSLELDFVFQRDVEDERNDLDIVPDIEEPPVDEEIRNIYCPPDDGYVRLPTPIPVDLEEEFSRSNSVSDIDQYSDSGNEPSVRQGDEKLPAISNRYESSSGSSNEDDSDGESTSICNRKSKRSPSPRDYASSDENLHTLEVTKRSEFYVNIAEHSLQIPSQRKIIKSSSTIKRKPTKLKLKNTEISRSAENLTTVRKSKRHREPERRKSDISVQTVSNELYKDESTNTSPPDSDLSRASSKRNISIQTSFDDTIEESRSKDFSESGTQFDDEFRTTVRHQPFRISSFEEAGEGDYAIVRNIIKESRNNGSKKKNGWRSQNSKSDESESLDEYIDADDEGEGSPYNGPIEYMIPNVDSNQAFWLIFSGEYTKAMNKDWHSGHFCCWQCDESLTGQRYVLRDEHPYCIKCYESQFANGCEECNKIIGIDSKDLSYKDKHWHEACFLCNKCRVSLVDKQFGSKVDKIYCGNCYDSQFASRCDGCGEIFRAGTKKMEYKTRQWHEKCFCCVVCKSPIGTKSFIPREQEIYCAGCYEDKFATRCVKCNKIITSGGVTYKNEPWHRDCFTCSHCNNSLAGQRFTSRDEKPYCADCFGELFAKRCTACTKPITGIGGTRFISFEDRHWHNDCFICAGCSTSLVGRGFITDGDDIICPDCAKSKLS